MGAVEPPTASTSRWQLDMGAQVLAGGRVRFRVWAPDARAVEVETYPPPEGIVRHAMERDDEGVWTGVIEGRPGLLYRYRLDEQWAYPDPYSRSQPEGIHGPSEVVDPDVFEWTDGGWRGLDPYSLVLYELHVGTYTPEGTFEALIGQLDAIRDLGVTAIELMPVVEFSGQRNWGYDGVDLYAPSSVYGGPEALRRLVNEAHARGLGVVVDVVYNHLGPEGNYLWEYAKDYFTDRYQTPWGPAINYDGENSKWVRYYFVSNALYWFEEFHIDGLRLDATHSIVDQGGKHVIQEITESVSHFGPDHRRVLVMAEDERNHMRLILPRDEGGYGLDALWVDDFHHTVHVMLTGEKSGYLGTYEGTAEEIARLLRVGYLYATPPEEPGETPAGVAPLVPAYQFIYHIQNHDQVGNRPFGRRLSHLVDLERYKTAAALLLVAPCTPLIFMGDEFAATSPFLYFTDHGGELGKKVVEGRRAEFKDFWAARSDRIDEIPNPEEEETFLRSRLDLSERERPPHNGVYRLYQELLRARREDPVLRTWDRWRMLAEAIAPKAVALERWDEEGRRRLFVANFGEEVVLDIEAQEWLGEAAQLEWRAVFSTAEERFGGPGADLDALTLRPGRTVVLPRHCAVRFVAEG